MKNERRTKMHKVRMHLGHPSYNKKMPRLLQENTEGIDSRVLEAEKRSRNIVKPDNIKVEEAGDEEIKAFMTAQNEGGFTNNFGDKFNKPFKRNRSVGFQCGHKQ